MSDDMSDARARLPRGAVMGVSPWSPEPTMLLENRVALITGANCGIGAATARRFAAQGAAVAINYHGEKDKAVALADEIATDGGRAIAVAADVTAEEEVRRMAKQVEETLGPVDTLVLNAGIEFKLAPFLEHDWPSFEAKLAGELKAAFFCSKFFATGMAERKAGSIIAVSTTLSRRPEEGFSSHCVAKAALDAFVRCLALELGPLGIRVNGIAPGLTRTESTAFLSEEQYETVKKRTPLRRIAEVEDIADAILAMATPLSRFVTGQNLVVSGGTRMP